MESVQRQRKNAQKRQRIIKPRPPGTSRDQIGHMSGPSSSQQDFEDRCPVWYETPSTALLVKDSQQETRKGKHGREWVEGEWKRCSAASATCHFGNWAGSLCSPGRPLVPPHVECFGMIDGER